MAQAEKVLEEIHTGRVPRWLFTLNTYFWFRLLDENHAIYKSKYVQYCGYDVYAIKSEFSE